MCGPAIGLEALPEPRQLPRPSAVVRHIDPANAAADRWLAAVRPEPGMVRPAMPATSPVAKLGLDAAARLSDEARKLLEQERGEDAATRHMQAAEWRRIAMAWPECVENYAALVKHYLERPDLRVAMAYLRKLMVVSERASDPAKRMEACLLAATVFVAFRQVGPAFAAASEASAKARELADASAEGRVIEQFVSIGTLKAELALGGETEACACGGSDAYPKCCGVVADEIPIELRDRSDETTPYSAHSSSEPWWSVGESGINLLLGKPVSESECLDWIAVRVKGGRHSLVSFPNWSGRAMTAARKMLEVSKGDPGGTAGPASAVLQVACALEAFVNAVTYFVVTSGQDRWETQRFPKRMFERDPGGLQNGSLMDRWDGLGRAMFGVRFLVTKRQAADSRKIRLRDDIKKLIDLRSALVHFKSDNAEQIMPAPEGDHKWLQAFAMLEDLRPAPAPWVDRVLTPGLAAWAVRLGDEAIGSFRQAWRVQAWEIENEELQPD